VDWEDVWTAAKSGRIEDIPANVRVGSYNALKRIQKDHMQPLAMERECFVFWGATNTGKTHRAWEEAGVGAYPKNSRTKFWDGYRGQEHVVIDEFTGDVALTNLLTWLDKYPVIIETKGGSECFCAKRVWLTSNVDPRQWYAGTASAEQIEALMRRVTVTYFPPRI